MNEKISFKPFKITPSSRSESDLRKSNNSDKVEYISKIKLDNSDNTNLYNINIGNKLEKKEISDENSDEKYCQNVKIEKTEAYSFEKQSNVTQILKKESYDTQSFKTESNDSQLFKTECTETPLSNIFYFPKSGISKLSRITVDEVDDDEDDLMYSNTDNILKDLGVSESEPDDGIEFNLSTKRKVKDSDSNSHKNKKRKRDAEGRKVRHKLNQGSYCRVSQHKKYKGCVGVVDYVESSDKRTVLIDNEIQVKVKCKYLEPITYEEYRSVMLNKAAEADDDDNDVEVKSKGETIMENSLVNLLENQLYSNLIVKIIDENFEGGQYVGEIVKIEDAYDMDECLCVGFNGSQWHIRGIRSKMLTIVPPGPGKVARVMKGEYKGSLVRRNLEGNDDGGNEIVDVTELEEEETLKIPLQHLCMCYQQ